MNKTEFTKQLLEAEKKCNLFDIEIFGKKIWRFLRITSFVFIYDYNAPYFDSKRIVNLPKTNLFQVILKRWKNLGSDIFFKDFPLFLKHTDILYFIGYTPKIKNGQSINSYVGDYILSTPKDISYSLFEWSDVENTQIPLNPQIKNAYYISHELIRLINEPKEFVSKQTVYDELNRLIFTPIEKETQIKFIEQVKEKVVYETLFHILYGEAYYKFYSYILNKIKPKLVLFFNADEPYTQILMDVCAKKGVKSAEIEHGMCFEAGNDVKFCSNVNSDIIFPSFYVGYGDVSKECFSKENLNCKYGFSYQNVQAVGRILLDEETKHQNESVNNGEKHCLIISSDMPHLIDFTIQLSKKLQQHSAKIIYKLHPIEFAKFDTIKENFISFNVIVKSNSNIYNLIKWADYVIGIESTVLYESVKLRKPTFIYGEYSKTHPLVKKNAAIGILSAEDFLKKIKDPSELKINYSAINYFFADNAKENYQKFLQEVVNKI